MKFTIRTILIVFTSLFCGLSSAQNGRFGSQSVANESLWQDRSPEAMQTNGTRYIVVKKSRNLQLDFAGMRSFLSQAPSEQATTIQNSQYILALPMPDGGFHHYRIVESSIMEAPLQAMFPEIRTYAGQGIEEPGAYIRLDATPQGFHAMVLRPGQSTIFVDPYALGDTRLYISYFRKDFTPYNKQMSCSFDEYNVEGLQEDGLDENPGMTTARLFGDCQKRTYRLAVAATGEYTAFHGGTVALAQAAQVTTMNRVNGVYLRDLAVQMNIVANNNLIVYTNAATDPYANGTPNTMITQNQTNCDNVIGSANYDIGHVFGTNSGGLAGLGVICSNGNKARGVTGSGAPVGDPFDIDYVAHEMGHQFGANHTQNNNCNRNSATAMETGSASTIMGYAGICAPNVQNNSDDYFHFVSLREMFARMVATNCPVTTSIPNNAPVLSPLLANYNIPRSTPFVLSVNATDADAADVLTYCWEQYDNQTSTQPPVATSTGGPNFRSFDPVTDNKRYFPRLSDLVNNTTFTWEVLSSVTRNMRFAVYVRDNHIGGTCGDNDSMTVRVTSTAGPFVVTAPTNTGITWPALSNQTVTWNVASTTAAPVSCANVDIFLSTDGGFTYPITLATGVPNNGSATISVPNLASTTCRVMVKGAGNIFFDISNNNFAITAATNDYTLTAVTTTQSVCAPANAVYTIAIGSLGGFSNPVTMSATSVPAGGTATFSPNPVTPGNNTTMTISGTGGIAAGTYTITVQGSSTTGIKTTPVTLTVASGPPAAATLTTPANGATNFSTGGTLQWNAITSATYDVQIASDVAFNNIVRSQTGLATNSWTITPILASSTTYYWRVRGVNGCGNGTWSTGFNFTTDNVVCNSTVSTTVPRTISASGTPTVLDSVFVGLGGTITDVNVTNLVGTHTWVSDLRMTLISPTGTSVVLLSQLCADNDNWNIKFDNLGAPYNSIACPMTVGAVHQPSGNMTTFNGQVPTGWWKLKIDDTADQDGGALTAWTLEVCSNLPPCTLTAAVNNSTQVACFGASTGSATVTPSNGTAPYTYAWSNGQTTPTATGLAAGNYTVTVTATGGCSSTATVSITQPASAVSGTTNSTATTCGLSNGTASASGSGGSGSGYSYAWSNGSTSASLSNLAAGSYTVTITDGNNCSTTRTVSVGSSTGITATTTGVQGTTCGQNNGTVTANGNGGTGYSYSWSNGSTNQTLSGLAAGNYTVTVTAAGGCTSTASVVIASSSAVTASTSNVQNTSCGLNNGSATAVGNGGTNYAYQWSNGATTSSISNLAAGAYTVTVTSGTCTATTTVNIGSSSGIGSSITGTVPAGCTVNNGTITAAGSGGSGNYTYLWNNGQTSATATGLGAGSYTVTVTDATSGCTSSSTGQVANTSGVLASIASSSNTTCGLSNGSATAGATGGNGNFTFSWSNGSTTATSNNLAAGTYTVTATDGNGCSSVANVVIGGSTAVNATQGNVVDEICGLGNGSATVNVSGGGAPYTFAWSNGQTTQTAINLPAGSYTVTVTDAGSCTGTATFSIQNISNMTVSVSNQVNVSCAGGNDGSATASPSNGTAPYTFVWSNGQTGQTASSLAAGSYTVTVTDVQGCQAVQSVIITEPTVLAGTTTSTDESTSGASDGTATANPSGGTPPYAYSWSNGQTSQTATGLAAGVYTVTVTDANGCTSVLTSTVNLGVGIGSQAEIRVDIFPNPNSGDFFVDFALAEISDVTIVVYNKLGQQVFVQSVERTQGGRVAVHLPDVADGVYSVELRTEKSIKTRKIMVNR
jgi:subtilisin-like proprotein convertase family protein